MRPVVLLDRDGVINVDLPTGVLSERELVLEASAPAAIARLTASGIDIIVCTNQACVGRRELSLEGLKLIHARITAEVVNAGGRIVDWFVCTHRAEDRCGCRKPAPGLLFQAQARYKFDLAATWFVGDSLSDVEAAEVAGARSALVLTGKGRQAHITRPLVPAFADLDQFAQAYVLGAI